MYFENGRFQSKQFLERKKSKKLKNIYELKYKACLRKNVYQYGNEAFKTWFTTNRKTNI